MNHARNLTAALTLAAMQLAGVVVPIPAPPGHRANTDSSAPGTETITDLPAKVNEPPAIRRDPPGTYGAPDRVLAEIETAIGLFELAGLDLPDLWIYVHDSRTPCDGHQGLYGKGGDWNRIDICVPSPWIARHELGHAWERHNVDDDTRQSFMEASGADAWNDHADSHPTRGVEKAADLIAWGTQDQPIQTMHAGFYETDLELYELLTGMPSPRVAHWNVEPAPSAHPIVVRDPGPIDIDSVSVID